MANKEASSGQQGGHIALALTGLVIATVGASLSEPLLTLSKKSHDKISVYLAIYACLFFLVPLTFYINMLLLLNLVTVQVAAPEALLSVFLNKHLPQAARVVSLANLLLGAPLLMHMSVAEESASFAVGAALVVLSLVSIFASAFKKILISSSTHAGRGFMPAFFAICIFTGTLISFEPILFFSNNNHHDPLIPFTLIHILLSFLSFFAFILSITLQLICVRAQSDGPHVTIYAKNLVINSLCVAIATIVVGWYMKVYMTVTGMGYVRIEAADLL